MDAKVVVKWRARLETGGLVVFSDDKWDLSADDVGVVFLKNGVPYTRRFTWSQLTAEETSG